MRAYRDCLIQEGGEEDTGRRVEEDKERIGEWVLVDRQGLTDASL